MAGGSLQIAQSPQTMLAQMAETLGGPAVIPQVQRSQYLADALQSIRADGAQNLKTPMALGSNLLAEALLAYGRSRNDAKLMSAINAGRASLMSLGDDITAPGAGAGGAAGGADTSGATPAAAPASYAAPTPPATAPQATPNVGLANAVSPQDEDAAVRAVWGEARGESPVGQQAVAGVIRNRAELSGEPISQVVAAPHQFAGYGPQALALSSSSPEYQAIERNIGPVLSGVAPNPAGNADHFYAPGAMPNGSRPAWDNGTGRMIGNQDFLALGYGGKPAGAFGQPAAPTGAPSTASADQPPPAPKPFQVSTGPDPSIPAPQPAAGASPFAVPASSSSPGAGASPPPAQGAGASSSAAPRFGQPGWQPPPVPLSQEQFQQFQRLRQLAQQSPQLYMQPYMQIVQELHAQLRTPEPITNQLDRYTGQIVTVGSKTGRVFGVQTPPGTTVRAQPMMVSDGKGGWTPVQGTQVQQLPSMAPGVVTQRNNATGQITNESIPNAVESGQAWNPQTGSYEPLKGLQPTTSGTYQPGTVISQVPGHAPQIVQQAPITAEAVNERGRTFNTSKQYEETQEALAALNGLGATVGKIAAGGPITQAGLDTYLRSINPGGTIRQGPVNVFLEHQNMPEELKGELMRLTGHGFLTPAVIRQMMQTSWGYANARLKLLQQQAATDQAWAKTNGYGAPALGENVPQMPDVPAYAVDQPPPPNARTPGMVVWSPKGPVTWTGHGWRTQ